MGPLRDGRALRKITNEVAAIQEEAAHRETQRVNAEKDLALQKARHKLFEGLVEEAITGANEQARKGWPRVDIKRRYDSRDGREQWRGTFQAACVELGALHFTAKLHERDNFNPEYYNPEGDDYEFIIIVTW